MPNLFDFQTASETFENEKIDAILLNSTSAKAEYSRMAPIETHNCLFCFQIPLRHAPFSTAVRQNVAISTSLISKYDSWRV